MEREGQAPAGSGWRPEDERTAIERETLLAALASGAPPDERRSVEDWPKAVRLIERLLLAALDVHGARTLADALDLDLGELAAAAGLRPELERIELANVAGNRRAAGEALAALAPLAERMSEREFLIAQGRIFAPDPATLQELGDRFGVSRERVRQLEARLRGKLRHPQRARPVEALARVLRRRWGPVASERDLDRRIGGLFAHAPERLAALAAAALRRELGYACEDGVCLSAEAVALAGRLRTAAEAHADDVGLIDEAALRAELSDESWLPHWEALTARCGFHRLAGSLALRNTQKAAVKAALLSVGEPATRERIAEAAGLRVEAVGSQLSNIPSVVRADRRRWALDEWVDDTYGGIAAGIVERIEADGGSTSLNRLIAELPRRYGVSAISVRAYAGAPQFAIEDGMVRLADESELTLRPLAAVMDGREPDGARYWTFEASERHFEGYSLLGVPPELAVALGCEPNDSVTAAIRNLPECRGLSVIWRLTSLAGASLGYLAEPLRRLGARPGDRVRVVLRGPGAVELRREA